MKIAFLNPQGNFDSNDSYWTEHPDFGGQLVYVKEVAIAMAELGHQTDILTRRVTDLDWPEFDAPFDHYRGVENVRIVRLPCGPERFLPKEELWPYLGNEGHPEPGKGWVPNILAFYQRDGGLPDAFTAHYADGALSGVLLQKETGVPFTFTGHSLGAQKMDKLGATRKTLVGEHAHFHFPRRIMAERLGMNHAGRIIASTSQERMEQYGHSAYRGAVDPEDDDRFAVVPPGVNLSVFSPKPSPEDIAIQQRIDAALTRDIAEGRQDLPLVVASSRLDGKKNHMGLVRAFGVSQKLRSAANLAIVVRGLETPLRYYGTLSSSEKAIMDEITNYITDQELWGLVTAFPLNSQQELASAYRVLAQRGSAFSLTALYEPFGLAPLEAMACGLPAVVTRNGGPTESMRQGDREYGVLVDPVDPSDIARGLLRIIGSTESWQRFHEAGMERVLTRYTWERTAQGYLGVINRMLQGPAHPGDLSIPEYYTNPGPETDISVSDLEGLYFRPE
ncbi:MAG: glycosyltransferase [Anaerolineae bacterium]|jgi:sucrose-phosphate synthase